MSLPQLAPSPPSLPLAPETGGPENVSLGDHSPRDSEGGGKGRNGKTLIGGHFTKGLARAVKLLAAERGVTVQALIGEGLDDVLSRYGKHPMGER